jgi:hypothetical protein
MNAFLEFAGQLLQIIRIRKGCERAKLIIGRLWLFGRASPIRWAL